MNRSVLLGLLGLATAGSMVAHLQRTQDPRYTPRKARQAQTPEGQWEWLNQVRRNLTTGQVEPADHIRMAKAVARYAQEQRKAADYQWLEMGPDNVGGRIRGICVDPNNSQKIWTGSVSGGLFRSMDGANTWQRIPSFNQNYMVSSIAVMGNGHIMVATGNLWESGNGSTSSGFPGAGLFRSTDDGATWTRIVGPTPNQWSGDDMWTQINRITAHPTDPNKLLVASSDPGGRIFNSTDDSMTEFAPGSTGTNNWDNGNVTDVDISSDGLAILVTTGASGDCYRSTDGGQSFARLNGSSNGSGFPQTNVGRLEMAISPDNGDYMYALGASGSGRMSGVWYSTDRGNNWFRIWPSNLSDNDVNAVPELDIFRDNQQGLYDNAIAVRPGHPEEVWIGGVELWKTSLSGQPQQLAQAASTPGCFFCVHADVHEIVFADAQTAYIGCDGGIHKTPNAGMNFYSANRDLAITQFYSVAYNAKGNVGGGTQDNGTQFIDGYGNTPNEAIAIGGGDGFDTDFSQLDTNIMFSSIYNGLVERSNDHGNNFGSFYDSSVPVDEEAELGVGLGDFYTNYRLWEDPNDQNSPYTVKKVLSIGAGDTIFPGESRTIGYQGGISSIPQYGQFTNTSTDPIPGPWTSDSLEFPDRITSMFAVGFTGTEGVWGTRESMDFNTTPQWAKLVSNVGGSTNCMEWSNDGDVLFYGTAEGEIFRVSGFDQAYDLNTLSVDSPGYALTRTQIFSGSAPVTGLAPDPTWNNVLVATFGGYGSSGKVRRTLAALNPTVTGTDWESIWNVPGELEGMPVYDAVINKENGNIIAAGTEFGVWVTDDAGQSWTMQTNGMEPVPVFAMRQQTWNWQNHPLGPSFVINPGYIYAGTHGRGIFRTEALVGIRPLDPPAANGVGDLLLMPNPANTLSTASFNLTKQGDVTVNVYDLNGALVRTVVRKNLAPVRQNIPIDVQAFANGTYIVEVVGDGARASGRLVVAR